MERTGVHCDFQRPGRIHFLTTSLPLRNKYPKHEPVGTFLFQTIRLSELTKNTEFGAGEMAQSEECLPCKYEEELEEGGGGEGRGGGGEDEEGEE